MIYYRVPKVGAGTSEDPYRPEIPDICWTGNVMADGTYLIVTKEAVVGLVPLDERDIEYYCTRNNISNLDVMNKWSIQ